MFLKNIFKFKSTFIRLDKKGFTIIELLVAAGIVVSLSLYFVLNFKGFNNSEALNSEAEKMASIIRQAQIYSLVGQTVSATRYNFGIYVEECAVGSCTYVLFSDLDGDNFYDLGEVYGPELISLNNQIYIADGDIDLDGSSQATDLSLVFSAPQGDIYYDATQVDEVASITLTHIKGGTKTITINRISGQIDIQ